MEVEETAIPAVKIVTPKKHGDARGFFSEVYNKSCLESAGLRFEFVQDNHSFSPAVGTLRGLHFQNSAFRSGQAPARRPGPHSRRRRRHPALLADLRQACRRRTVGAELAPAARADRLRPRLRHARAGHRGSVQDDRRLFAGQRPGPRLGRSRHRNSPGRCRPAARCCRTRTSAGPGSRTLRSCFRDAHRRHGLSGPSRDVPPRARGRRRRDRGARPAGGHA